MVERAMPLVQLIWSLGMSAAEMDHNSGGLLIRQLIFQKNYNTYVLGNREFHILGVERSFWKLLRL